MNPIGDRIHDELGQLVETYVASPGLPEHIEARTRQRARNRRRGTVGAMATLILLTAGALAVANRDRGGSTLVSGSRPAATTSIAASAPATTTPATTAPAPVVLPAAAPPPSFLAAVGGGNEQAVVVDTASGHILHPLSAAPPGQMLWVVSPDGRTLYAPTQQGGCGRGYLAIDTATGVSKGPAFAGINDLTSVAPSPDGHTLAYTAGCGSVQGVSDVHLRRPNGSTTSVPAGGHAIQLSWNPDGTMLALIGYHDGGDALQVWDVGASTVTGPRVIPAPDAGCSLGLPRFATDALYAVEQCPPNNVSGSSPVTLRLVRLEPTSGAKRQSWSLARAPYAMAADLAIDPSGGWALYSVGTPSINGQVSLLSLGSAAAKARVLLSDAFAVAWLPASHATLAPPTATTRPQATTPPTVAATVASTTTSTVSNLPSCTSGAPTTPYFINGCRRPDGSIQPPQ